MKKQLLTILVAAIIIAVAYLVLFSGTAVTEEYEAGDIEGLYGFEASIIDQNGNKHPINLGGTPGVQEVWIGDTQVTGVEWTLTMSATNKGGYSFTNVELEFPADWRTQVVSYELPEVYYTLSSCPFGHWQSNAVETIPVDGAMHDIGTWTWAIDSVLAAAPDGEYKAVFTLDQNSFMRYRGQYADGTWHDWDTLDFEPDGNLEIWLYDIVVDNSAGHITFGWDWGYTY